MTYEVEFSETAKRQMAKLDRAVQKQIFKKLERVRIRPERFLVKMVGDPSYKLRVGDYRLLIDINQGKLLLLILRAGHRGTIYKDK